jgi:hypothetical protein
VVVDVDQPVSGRPTDRTPPIGCAWR